MKSFFNPANFIIMVIMIQIFSCSLNDVLEPQSSSSSSNLESSSSDGYSSSSNLKSSSSSNGNVADLYLYCYGYLSYRDCNLIGGRWIPDTQYCFSGDGFLVTIDYCTKNGIGIDNTPNYSSSSSSSNPIYYSSSNQIYYSSEAQCVPNYGQNLMPGSYYCPSSSSSISSSSFFDLSSSSSSKITVGCPSYNSETHFCDSRDYKIYRKVEMGNQTWMAENLNYSGSNGNLGKCYANSSYNCETYGRLYNWSAAMSICPAGWHIPSFEEWNELVVFAGNSRSGKNLKAKEGWYNCGPSDSGNDNLCEDTFGFSAMPGGADFDNGTGNLLRAGNVGYWWTSTENANYYAYCYDMVYNREYTNYSISCEKSMLYSVRCVKD
jgi:uncharacterized protein (TIGR02145 family)